MKTLFLSPHNDDETLFGAFTILRHHPHVVVCLKSVKQEQMGGPFAMLRETETARALWWLGSPTWEQWQVPDVDPDWGEIKRLMIEFDQKHPELERVFAPESEPGGHEQHNTIGMIAVAAFGREKVTSYHTYRRGHGRTKIGEEVPFEPQWVMRKLRAMSCYESQFSDALGTMPWFVDEGLREFYA